MKYRARYDQAKKAIREARKTETAKAKDPSKLPYDKWKRAESAMDNYFDNRSKVMETGMAMLKNTSATAADQADDWREYFQKAAEDAHKRINGLLDGNTDLKSLDLVYKQILYNANIEQSFLSRLSGIPLAGMQGRINDHRKKFEEEQKNLRDKFEDLKSKDRSFDDRISRTVDELEDMYERNLDKVVKAHMELARRLIKWVSAFRGLDESANPETPTWLGPVDNYLKELNRLTVSPEAYKKRLDGSFRSEGTLVMLFGKTRTDVKKFLEGVNLELVEDQLEETKKASLDKVTGMIPPGLDNDGKAFVEDCAKEVQTSFWSFTVAFNSFVNEFRGVFLGPVGDRTVEDLLEPKEGEAAGNRIKALHVERKLRELQDKTRDWDLNFDGIHKHHREHIEEMMYEHLYDLGPKIKAAGDLSLRDANALALKMFKQQMVDRLKRLVGWGS